MLFENNMDLDSSSDKLDELQAFIDNKYNEQINKTTIASMINEFKDHLNSEKRKRESANSSPQSNSHQSPITTNDPSKRTKTSTEKQNNDENFSNNKQKEDNQHNDKPLPLIATKINEKNQSKIISELKKKGINTTKISELKITQNNNLLIYCNDKETYKTVLNTKQLLNSKISELRKTNEDLKVVILKLSNIHTNLKKSSTLLILNK